MNKRCHIALMIGFLTIAFSSNCLAGVDCHTEIDPSYLEVDVESLIHIKTPGDVERIRNDIILYFWPEKGISKDKMPASVQRVSADGKKSKRMPDWILSIGSENLDKVDRLDIEMDYDLHSYVYHLHPKTSINRLLIFQMGHSNDILAAGGRETIKFFLDKGFSIMTFWMPLFGENPIVARDVPGHGTYTFPASSTKGHNVMAKVLDNSKGCFIRFFVEPVFVSTNYAQSKYDYRDINMVGISGGGWTTHVCAAIDPRIKLNFPVAGSLPLYLRRGACPNGSAGDAEQEWPALFEQRASWLDIYIMGGYGQGRGQVQILNQYDSCCFWGVNYRTYESHVTKAVESLGKGFYYAFLDSSHKDHRISDKAISQIIDKHLSSVLIE